MHVFRVKITEKRKVVILRCSAGDKRPGGVGVCVALEKLNVMQWYGKPLYEWTLTKLGKEIATVLDVPNVELRGSPASGRVPLQRRVRRAYITRSTNRRTK